MLKPKQKDVLFHLGYEWWMFRATYALLKKLPIDDDPVRNALVESLLIHSRGLIDFFFDFGHQPTDWQVLNLGNGLTAKPKTTFLTQWREIVNKRVAHLTHSRELSLTGLDIEPIYVELQICVAAVKAALNADIPSDWIGDRSTETLLITSSAVVGTAPTPGPIGTTGPRKI